MGIVGLGPVGLRSCRIEGAAPLPAADLGTAILVQDPFQSRPFYNSTCVYLFFFLFSDIPPPPFSPQLNGLPADDPTAPLLASTPVHAGPRAHGACPRSQASLEKLQDVPGQPKRRGRPPTKFLKQMEQKYLTQLREQPVPSGESRAGGSGGGSGGGSSGG